MRTWGEIDRFEVVDRHVRSVRVFTRVKRRISQYDRHLLNRKPRPGG